MVIYAQEVLSCVTLNAVTSNTFACNCAYFECFSKIKRGEEHANSMNLLAALTTLHWHTADSKFKGATIKCTAVKQNLAWTVKNQKYLGHTFL